MCGGFEVHVLAASNILDTSDCSVCRKNAGLKWRGSRTFGAATFGLWGVWEVDYRLRGFRVYLEVSGQEV